MVIVRQLVPFRPITADVVREQTRGRTLETHRVATKAICCPSDRDNAGGEWHVTDTGRPFEIGFLLMPTEDSARGTFPRWTEMLALVQRAEALGFDSVWIPDHLIIDI